MPRMSWISSERFTTWPWPFFVLGAIGVVAAFVWAYYMHEPRNHPAVSRAELDYIIQGGALVDIDSAHERTQKAHLSGAVVKSLLGRQRRPTPLQPG